MVASGSHRAPRRRPGPEPAPPFGLLEQIMFWGSFGGLLVLVIVAWDNLP